MILASLMANLRRRVPCVYIGCINKMIEYRLLDLKPINVAFVRLTGTVQTLSCCDAR